MSGSEFHDTQSPTKRGGRTNMNIEVTREMDQWLMKKHDIKGWRNYHYLKSVEGWSIEKINNEYEKLMLDMEEQNKSLDMFNIY